MTRAAFICSPAYVEVSLAASRPCGPIRPCALCRYTLAHPEMGVAVIAERWPELGVEGVTTVLTDHFRRMLRKMRK